MEGQCKAVRGEKQACERGREVHRVDAERKGWGTQVCREGQWGTQKEELASKTT